MEEWVSETYRSGSGVLNNLGWVHWLGEDSVELVDEVTVVDETRLSLDFVSHDELINLGLSQIDLQSA